MKISIITTITNPEERQDNYREALNCYMDFADEVIVVNGGTPSSVGYLFKHPKIKEILLEWPENWNWVELPKHLNKGLEACTGDWIVKMDIDHFIHEKDMLPLKMKLSTIRAECETAILEKTSFTYGNKYYEKGGSQNIFRNSPFIRFGKNIEKDTDLCFPIRVTGEEYVYDEKDTLLYKLPIGKSLSEIRTGISYWNYDFYFKDRETIEKIFWSSAQAYYRYFKDWKFGSTKETAFKVFLDMLHSRYRGCPYTAEIEQHPKYIRDAIKNLKEDRFGYNGFN